MESPNHPIRPRQHGGWNRDANLLCRFQIDDELKLRRLLYRQIGGLRTFQDLVNISGSTLEQVGIAWGIGQQPPVLHILWLPVYCWQPALYRAVCNLFSMSIEDGTHQHEHCVSTLLACGSERSLNILRI